jgi:tRNA (guanosine-2'-O-)-methyltransferase
MATDEREQRVRAVAARRQRGVVVLEDIASRYNAAAVYRTVEAIGFQQVWLIFGRAEPFDPRLTGQRAATSAAHWLDFRTFDSTDACLAQLKCDDFTLAATVIGDAAESIYEADLAAPDLALLIGNEETGLSQGAIDAADLRITIPMSGMMQSLNLSVTAALCLSQIVRQRAALGMDRYLLPQAERHALAERWLYERRRRPRSVWKR